MHKSSNRTVSYAVLSLLVSLFILSCGDNNSTQSGQTKAGQSGSGAKRPIKAIPVEVTRAKKSLAASFYVTTATIEPNSDAKINSRTSGVVKQILHEEGDDVESGKVLLILDDDDQQLRLKQAKQTLQSTQREFDRLSKMKKAGVVSPTEWETTENNYRSAETEHQLAELALSYTRVAAPFKGRVVWREVDLGAHVGQGELLFRMMSIQPLLVRVHIPANRLGLVAVGQKVEITVDSAPKPLNAVVELVSPIVDPNTGTIKITLTLDEYPDSVRPGDFAEVQMVTDKHENALLIPSVAIIEERGQHYLYIAENGKALRRSVTPGFVMSDLTEIIGGITETDAVVIKGQRNLNDDVVVEILADNSSSDETKDASSAIVKGTAQ